SINPNPFKDRVSISYDINEAGLVLMDIYNVRGQLVRSLVRETKQARDHGCVWDGTDDKGMQCGSGIYIINLRAGKQSINVKVVRIK
ncbi:MAG: T9SS type A sorting domain-containing protein, partial [Candidatus Cloacimonadaceae bacterium]|nr:T9SS type A sorting domain-containing protein [Candidatus Cloacimonadaceae bacterium]